MSLEYEFITRNGQPVQCSQFFLSGCTASFNSANLRLRTRDPITNDPQNNNATWKIDISFLKDSAGNSPPPDTWRTFEVLNLPPEIILQ